MANKNDVIAKSTCLTIVFLLFVICLTEWFMHSCIESLNTEHKERRKSFLLMTAYFQCWCLEYHEVNNSRKISRLTRDPPSSYSHFLHLFSRRLHWENKSVSSYYKNAFLLLLSTYFYSFNFTVQRYVFLLIPTKKYFITTGGCPCSGHPPVVLFQCC